mgnify:CR=1 FL=1
MRFDDAHRLLKAIVGDGANELITQVEANNMPLFHQDPGRAPEDTSAWNEQCQITRLSCTSALHDLSEQLDLTQERPNEYLMYLNQRLEAQGFEVKMSMLTPRSGLFEHQDEMGNDIPINFLNIVIVDKSNPDKPLYLLQADRVMSIEHLSIPQIRIDEIMMPDSMVEDFISNQMAISLSHAINSDRLLEFNCVLNHAGEKGMNIAKIIDYTEVQAMVGFKTVIGMMLNTPPEMAVLMDKEIRHIDWSVTPQNTDLIQLSVHMTDGKCISGSIKQGWADIDDIELPGESIGFKVKSHMGYTGEGSGIIENLLYKFKPKPQPDNTNLSEGLKQ